MSQLLPQPRLAERKPTAVRRSVHRPLLEILLKARREMSRPLLRTRKERKKALPKMPPRFQLKVHRSQLKAQKAQDRFHERADPS